MICGKRGRSKAKTLLRKSSFFRAREQKTPAVARFDRALNFLFVSFFFKKKKNKAHSETNHLAIHPNETAEKSLKKTQIEQIKKVK
jgi:hypothetical protein